MAQNSFFGFVDLERMAIFYFHTAMRGVSGMKHCPRFGIFCPHSVEIVYCFGFVQRVKSIDFLSGVECEPKPMRVGIAGTIEKFLLWRVVWLC
jgi:hypothetical protein